MSIYFSAKDGRDVWNPSSDVAEAFLAQAGVMARILAIESGLGPIVSDEVAIDGALFDVFSSAFAKRMVSYDQHAAFPALMGACFAVVLGLRRALGLPDLADDPRVKPYVEAGAGLVSAPLRLS